MTHCEFYSMAVEEKPNTGWDTAVVGIGTVGGFSWVIVKKQCHDHPKRHSTTGPSEPIFCFKAKKSPPNRRKLLCYSQLIIVRYILAFWVELLLRSELVTCLATSPQKEARRRLVAFVNCCGVNTPTMARFKPLTRHHWRCVGKTIHHTDTTDTDNLTHTYKSKKKNRNRWVPSTNFLMYFV